MSVGNAVQTALSKTKLWLDTIFSPTTSTAMQNPSQDQFQDCTLSCAGSSQTASKGRSWRPSHGEVLSALLPIANEWKTIGTLLGLPPGKLDSIQKESHTEHGRLCGMITEWLKNPGADWEELLVAVKKIDPWRASEIEDEFCS